MPRWLLSQPCQSSVSILSCDSFCNKFDVDSADIFFATKQMSFTVMYLDFYTPDSVSSGMDFFDGGS